MTIEFRPTVRTPEERQEMAAAFETWREWKRSQGNEVDLARLRNRFLNALGPDPLESLRRQVAPAFAELVKNLEGVEKDVAAIGSEIVLQWPEAQEVRRRLEEWANRWSLLEADPEDPWIRRAALRTLAYWYGDPDAPLAWRHTLPARWFLFLPPLVSKLANVLMREGREAAERWIRDVGQPRAYARAILKALQDNTTVTGHRLRRHANLDADDHEASENRSLEWLAARCRGVSDAETARAAGVTRQAVSLSNRRAAELLGLTFRPRRGRPPKRASSEK